MAKINLEYVTNLDPLQRAGQQVHALNTEAQQLGQTMTDSFRKANKSTEDFDKTLKKTSDDAKKFNDEIQKNSKFSTAFQDQANKVNELKEAYKNLALAGRENGKVARSIKDEYEKLEKQLNDVSSSMKKVEVQSESFGSKLSTMATGFVAGQVITGGLQKIGQAFSHAIDIQKEFEKSIQNLSAITGASDADLDFYSEQALKLGVTVKGGATSAVEAFKLIGSAKPELLANKEALVGVTEQAILLSQATGLELPDAATRLTDAMNQFGASSDQAGLFVDTLAAGAKFGASEVPQITEALLKFGVAAKASNINIVESTAAIELLGEKGLKGAEAGTALRNVFAKLSATKVLPKEAKKELEDAGINLKLLSDNTVPLQARLQELSKIQNNANALTRVFGLDNKNAAQSILQNLPRLEELTKQIGEQGLGSATEQASKNMDTLDQALLESENQYNNLILSITSGDFGELMKDFVKSANDSLKAFASQVADTGTLFTKGFGGLEDKKFKEQADNIAKSYAHIGKNTDALIEKEKQLEVLRSKTNNPEQLNKLNALIKENKKAIEDDAKLNRSNVANGLANEIKSINVQLQNNKNLTEDQKSNYREQIKNKATLVNAILALDKKQAVASNEVITENLQEGTDETAKELEKRKKLYEDFQKALLDLNKRVQQAQLEQANPEDKIRLQKQFAQEELDLYKDQFIKVGKLADSNFKLSLAQEQQFLFLRNAINVKASQELVKLEVDRQNKIAQARLNSAKQTAENLALEEQNLISGVGLAGRPSDVSEADFEKIKQRQILDIQSEYAMKKLELKKQSIAAEQEVAIKGAEGELKILEGKDDEESNQKRKNIVDNLALVSEKYAREGEAVQDATAKTINDIQKQRDEIDKQQPFNLMKYLGLAGDDLNNLRIVADKMVETFDRMLEAQIKAYDQTIEESKKKQDQLDSEIQTLNSKLEQEQDISDRGLANNQDRIRAEIALKEEQKAKEQELELKAIEEKKKIQKQRLILDSALQLSNMILASTEIYAKAAATGGPAGVPIAIAAISAMFGAFIAEKALALKAINEGNGFKEGVIDLKGPGTETSDSIPARLSKGESVMTAKVTKKRKSLLEALASDQEALIKRALIDELKDSGVTLNTSLPKELANKKDSIKSIENNIFKPDNSAMEKKLTEINSKLQAQINANKNKTYLDQNGNLVKKFGSHTSIIKKRNG